MNENENTSIVVIDTKPLLRVNIDTVAAQVKHEIDSLNLDEILPTEENKKIITELRTKLNKQQKAFEDDRKKIKNALLAPYDVFEKEYKEKILTLYAESLDKINNALTTITVKQKQVFRDYALEYFLKTKEARALIEDVSYDERFIDLTNNTRIRNSIDKRFDDIQNALTIIATYGENKDRLHILWRNCQYDLPTALIRLNNDLKSEALLKAEKEASRKRAEEEIAITLDFSEPEVIVEQESTFSVEPSISEKNEELVVEQVYEYALKMKCTYNQAIKVSEFLETQGIEFDWVE